MEHFRVEETTIADIHAAYRAGAITCVQLTQAYLDRIAAYDQRGPTLNSYVTLNPTALERAAELDAIFASTGEFAGPLHGVPYAVKDQAETAGLETSFGVAALKGYIPERDATIIVKLRAAGAVLLGKTTMPDFAASWWGYGSVHGLTCCAYAPERDSGGSSGGTGAAVAANLCAVGVGEDTGGSIRLPASANNLAGLRVTPGMISRNGLSPLVVPLDTAGPMARTVTDLATLLDALVGYDPDDPYTAVNKTARHTGSYTRHLVGVESLRGARFGMLAQAFGDDADADCAPVNEVVRAAIEEMKGAGAEFVQLSLPNLAEEIAGTSLYLSRSRNDIDTFLQSRPALAHSSLREAYATGTCHKNLDLIQLLATVSPEKPEDDPEYFAKVARGTAFQRTLVGLMAERNLDGLCHPALRILTPTHADMHQLEKHTALAFPTNTVIASQSLIPSICVPAGFSTEGVPVGMEIVAPPHHEPELIRLGYACEQLLKRRRPSEFVPAL